MQYLHSRRWLLPHGRIGYAVFVDTDTQDALPFAYLSIHDDAKEVVVRMKDVLQAVQRHRVATGERYRVKCITVDSAAKRRLHQQHHRAERWIVVNGIDIVTRGEEDILFIKNQSRYIPLASSIVLKIPVAVWLRSRLWREEI